MNIGTENQNTNRNRLIENAVRQYADLIFRIAYQQLSDYHDAQDILQEVAVALVASDAPLKDEKHLKNWVCRVTINKCINHRKSAQRHSCQPLTDEIAINFPESHGVTEQLKKLPKNYRIVLYLYYFEDFTIDEIAAILKKSRNTISSQLRRGREKLKKILTEGGFEYV